MASAQVRRQGGEGQGGHRQEDQAHAQSLYEAGPDHREIVHLQIEVAHPEEGEGEEQKAGDDEKPRVDTPDQPAGEEHRDQAADAARRLDQARGHHRIAKQGLGHRRQERHHREDQQPHRQP
jgi:hypothetical protein